MRDWLLRDERDMRREDDPAAYWLPEYDMLQYDDTTGGDNCPCDCYYPFDRDLTAKLKEHECEQ